MPSSKKRKKTCQQPYYLLALDPAEAAGWALFEQGKLIMCGSADGSKWKTFYTALLQAHDAIATTWKLPDRTAECVIEDGFFIYGRATFKGALTLGLRRGLAQAAAEAIGLQKFTFIGPSTWQSALGWKRGQDTKEFSLAYAKQRWGVDGITHDVADAICLGSYYLDMRQAEG